LTPRGRRLIIFTAEGKAIRHARWKLFLLIAFLGLSPVLPASQDQIGSERLGKILEKAAFYCRKMDRAALDFVCFEEVTEMTNRHTERNEVFLYDYQFVRKGEETKEQRNLIAINGRKIRPARPPVQPAAFRYKNVFFGPIGLLSETWQAYHDFRIAGEEKVFGETAVVIEATPNAEEREPHPYGRIWIREKDGSVLKIVWDQRSLGNFGEIEEWAKENEAEPLITAYSEYRYEKNGLRFPSLNYTEQAYIRKDGTKFTNARISVVYKGYKFFVVETQVKY
jgi:hypothetical protein